MNRRNFIQLAASGILLSFAGAAQPATKRFNLAIYPGTGLVSESLSKLMESYKPLETYIEQTTGEDVKITVARSIARADHLIDNVHFLFVPPTVAVEAMDNRFLPLVKSSVPAQGFLVASKQFSGSIRDLRGNHNVAFTERGSWLERMGKLVLADAGIKLTDSQVNYLSSGQGAVLSSLENGIASAGTLRKDKADAWLAKGGRILAELPQTPDYTFVANPDVDPAIQAKLKLALLQTPKEILAQLQKGIHAPVSAGFREAREADYKMIRRAMELK